VISNAHGGNKRVQLNEKESRKLINKEVASTAKRRGQAKSKVKPISDQSLKNVETRMEITTATAEDTTNARVTSCKSVRNAVSFFLVAWSVRDARIIINFDAKSWEMGDKKKK
jgi:hypothetical protein